MGERGQQLQQHHYHTGTHGEENLKTWLRQKQGLKLVMGHFRLEGMGVHAPRSGPLAATTQLPAASAAATTSSSRIDMIFIFSVCVMC